MIRNLTANEIKGVFIEARDQLDADGVILFDEEVPDKYIQLAAYTGREAIRAFAIANSIELPAYFPGAAPEDHGEQTVQ